MVKVHPSGSSEHPPALHRHSPNPAGMDPAGGGHHRPSVSGKRMPIPPPPFDPSDELPKSGRHRIALDAALVELLLAGGDRPGGAGGEKRKWEESQGPRSELIGLKCESQRYKVSGTRWRLDCSCLTAMRANVISGEGIPLVLTLDPGRIHQVRFGLGRALSQTALAQT